MISNGGDIMGLNVAQRLIIMATVLAAAAPLPVRAQSNATVAGPDVSEQQTASAETSLSEITVTATRISERLGRVAESVTALNQEKLDQEGVRSMDDIARLTPGVLFTNQGTEGTTTISIRGIGSSVGASTTGIYIDDTPVQVRSLGFGATDPYPDVFDLARVEVLRGPQGTLFGAGSEGGTVRFITPQPNLSRFVGYSRVDFSTTDHGGPNEEAGAALGGPIVEGKLGFRASIWAQHESGYIDRVSAFDQHTLDSNSNWRNAYVARLALAYAPVDWLTITPSVYYQQAYQNNSIQYYERISAPDDGVFRSADPLGSPLHDRFYLPALKIEADLGALTLISVTSDFVRRGDPDDNDYSHSLPMLLLGTSLFDNTLYIPGYPDYTLLSQFYNKQDNFTQEIRLQTADANARLTGVVGVFLQRARQQDTQLLVDPLLQNLISAYFPGLTVQDVFGAPMLSPDLSYESQDISHDNQEAIFGEMTYRLVGGLKATAGLRYARTHFIYSNFQAGAWAGTTGLGVSGRQDENPVTPKFGLSYQINEENMVYATVSKGYRVGGVNKPIPVTSDSCRADLAAFGLTPSVGSYDSDHVWSYEVGAKDNVLGGRMQIYSSAYYIKWSNIQQSLPLTHCGFNFISNVGSAISEGADLQFQAQLGSHVNISGTVSYNDAYYNKPVFGAPDSITGARGVVVAEGDALPSVPWTETLSAEFDQGFRDSEGYVRFTYTHSSHNNRPEPGQDPSTLSYDPAAYTQPVTSWASARAGVRLYGMDISLYANNLFDSHPVLTRINNILGAALYFDTTSTPRTVGITGTYHF